MHLVLEQEKQKAVLRKEIRHSYHRLMQNAKNLPENAIKEIFSLTLSEETRPLIRELLITKYKLLQLELRGEHCKKEKRRLSYLQGFYTKSIFAVICKNEETASQLVSYLYVNRLLEN